MIYRCTLSLTVITSRGSATFSRKVEREELPPVGRVIDFSLPGEETPHRYRVMHVIERFNGPDRHRIILEPIERQGDLATPDELFRSVAGADADNWSIAIRRTP